MSCDHLPYEMRDGVRALPEERRPGFRRLAQ
jgi:hypothetical protein